MTNLFCTGGGLTAVPTLPAGVAFADLSGNSITELAQGDFKGAASTLKALLLNNNAITTIASAAFAGLASLTKLTLADNALVELPTNPFQDCVALSNLDLSGNQLTSISNIGTLGALKRLNVTGNAVTSLEAGVIVGWPVLETLSLAANNLAYVPQVRYLQNSVRSIDLSSNIITGVDRSDFGCGIRAAPECPIRPDA